MQRLNQKQSWLVTHNFPCFHWWIGFEFWLVHWIFCITEGIIFTCCTQRPDCTLVLISKLSFKNCSVFYYYYYFFHYHFYLAIRISQRHFYLIIGLIRTFITFSYNNHVNALALIVQSAMVYCASKCMEKSCIFWIIIQIKAIDHKFLWFIGC